MCRRQQLQRVQDCKVLPKEAVAKQHKIVVCKTEQTKGKKRLMRIQETQWWKLNDVEHEEQFVKKVHHELEQQEEHTWDVLSKMLKTVAKTVLGKTSGKAGKKAETWWCIKREKKKEWDLNRFEETING